MVSADNQIHLLKMPSMDILRTISGIKVRLRSILIKHLKSFPCGLVNISRILEILTTH